MLSKLRPEVCLPKENLISPGQLCSEVYLLVRGVLQGQPAEEGRKGGGAKGGAKLRFRAIERTGAAVGMRDPFEKDFRYPFDVKAVFNDSACKVPIGHRQLSVRAVLKLSIPRQRRVSSTIAGSSVAR